MPTILITGATAGFGQATARRFARAGWTIVGTGRREERLRTLAEEIGPTFHGLAFDITDPAAVAAALESISTERPHWMARRRPLPDHSQGSSGNGAGSSRATSWQQVLSGKR